MSIRSYLFVLLICSLAAVPAAAATTQQADAPACAESMAPFTEATPTAGLDGPGALQSCTAEYDCPSSTDLFCTGTSSCEVYIYSISCDGNREYCACYGSVCFDGSDPYCRCDCLAAGGTQISCVTSCRQDCPPFIP